MIDKKRTNLTITMTAMMICVTGILGFTPIGTIPLGVVQITIAHLPAIITAMTVGFIPSLAVGLSLGVMSLIRAVAMPSSPLDPFFFNPIVSVLPRILIAVTTYFVFMGIRKLMKKWRARDIVSVIAGAAVGSMTNTVLVLLALYFIYFNELVKLAGSATVEAVLWGIATLNGLSEMAVTTALCVIIVLALQKTKLSQIE